MIKGDKLAEVEQRFDTCSGKLSDKCTIIESAADEESLIRMWGARKNALNRATKLTVGSRKPIGLIEDTVVHPDGGLESTVCDYVFSVIIIR
jgi:glycolate oxidase